MLMVLLGWAMWFGGAMPAIAARIERVTVRDDAIEVRFDEPVSGAARSFVLDAPQRIAVDVDGVAPGGTVETAGPVSAVRQGRQAQAARLVFDLARPVVVSSGRLARDGRTLTLALKDVSAPRFAQASLAAPVQLFGGRQAARATYKLSIPVPPAKRGTPLPRVRGEEGRPLVVIDAGHGGVDPGAIAAHNGLREKDLTLRIAKAIRDELLASGRVRVALTREDDRYLVHRERFGVARRLKADLFVSIHCDSVGQNTAATGASVYTLSEVASDREAARLAARENKSDIIGGVDLGGDNADVSSILIDLAQRETMNSSASFARLLGREAKPLIPTKANFHRMASLLVLKAPDMPSVLLETGYLSNPVDAEFLDSADGRRRIAQSVRRATEIFFARRMAQR